MKGSSLFLRLLVGCAALCLSWGPAQAESPLENLFRNAKYGSAALSPNGKYLATTANINGKSQLAVVEIETGSATNVAGYGTLDVTGIRWISDERMVYNIIDRDGEQTSSYAGLYAVNRDGSQSFTLMDSPEHLLGRVDLATWLSEPRWLRMLAASLDNDPNAIIAVGYFPSGDAVPYRVDSLTGKRKEIEFDVNGLARSFVLDAKNLLRVVTTTNSEHSQMIVWYRDQLGQPWRKLSEHSTFEPKFEVLGFDADGTTMFVSAPVEEGRWGIYNYDFVHNGPGELIASDKTVDVTDGLVFAPDTRKVLGVRLLTAPPKTLWFDKGMASLQLGVDRAFPATVNVIHPGNTMAPMLIHSYSSTHPGQYSLYYPDKKKLQNLFASRPWIDPKTMAVQYAYDYQASDGLPILSYLTLPLGREAKALPLVVSVHGGPWSRDHWGFNPEVQFLASMGYAVLQPQFRGSTGFGSTHLKKSFAQWGLTMQDDLTDGVLSLVKQGVVDPKRVCIMGASYGGYAAMMGLVKDPDLYRCGINLLGVTDLFYISSSGTWGNKAATYSLNKTLGDPDKLHDQFTATSPAKHADRIKAPVFMAYGEKDHRVPLIHGEDMRDGLKKYGKTYEYMELKGEEHGFSSEQVKFKVFGAIETFLKKYNPAN